MKFISAVGATDPDGRRTSGSAAAQRAVVLDDDVQSILSARAKSQGIALSELINGLLKKEIELIEALK